MFNLLKKPNQNEGVVHVQFDLHWLKHVHAMTSDHEFTPSWGRKMEELVIPVGSIHAEETPPLSGLQSQGRS